DLSRRDDRVFAPYPDTWPLGEPFLLPSAIGYPWSRLAGSDALGYNVPYFLAAAVGCFAAGLVCADLAGSGWAALLGALLCAWSPGRLNNFGVLGTIWAGFASLVLLFALRYLRCGRLRDAVACSAALLVVGLGSPYPLVMGTVAVAVVSVAAARSLGRAGLLGIGGSVALSILALVYAPYFRLARDFDAPVGLRSIEVHAADLLSILHTGVFAGPLRDLLDALVPIFPEGASALFPTLTALFVLSVGALLLRRHPRALRRPRSSRHAARSLVPWLLLAGLSFSFALGPTIRFAGRAVAPGPYALLTGLPGFSGMRGIHRWDQWFGLGVIVAATLVLGRLLRALPARRGRLLLAGVVPVLALDLWTRPVPAQAVPAPSPFDAEIRALPRDAIVAVWPFERGTSERSWAEQLSHRRRVLNGFQTFPPPIHLWLDSFLSDKPFEAAFAVYTELGASAIEVDLEAAPPGSGERLGTLLASGALPGGRAAKGSRSRLLLLLEPKAPILVDPRTIEGLRFDGDAAVVARSEGRLAFRLGSERLPVVVETSSGPVFDVLRIPVVGAGELSARLSFAPPPGAVVRTASDGREIGRAVSAVVAPPAGG
ncbi:MAG TPA: hypothetical protein PKA62_06225, partial [Thermoanaerobaculia bacterium]|nr:hypothetical protein [Thermoanaerobaculia bacterium]